jgi:hypothetical protein
MWGISLFNLIIKQGKGKKGGKKGDKGKKKGGKKKK